MIRGHRMSLLETTQYCGLVGRLNSEHGSGRAAVVSRAYHARLAGAPDAERLLSGLTPEEKDDVMTWNPPTDVVLGHVVLRYADAEHEVPVALDSMGEYVEPTDSCDAITLGHLDFAWDVPGTPHLAYVGDLKRSKWTPSYDPESLQLHAYGRAYAKKHNCDGYVTGCWAAIEGEWRWCKDVHLFEQIGTELIWDRIYYAATNNGQGCTGPHCNDCFSRTHCPEYLLPAALGDTPLAMLCKRVGDGILPDADSARLCLDFIGRLKTLAEAADKQIKAMVRSGQLDITDEDGTHKWVPVECKGRSKLNEAKLAEVLGDLTPYRTQGAPYEQFRWLKIGQGR